MLQQDTAWSPYKGLLSHNDSRADRVWSIFYGNHLKTLGHYSDFVSPEYLSALKTLNFRNDKIPSLTLLRSKIQPFGWDIAPVSGYLKGDILFSHLRDQRFPLSLPIRAEQFVDHSPMPDFIHDVLGHYPFLLVDEYRQLIQRLAQRYLDAPVCPLEDKLYDAQDRLGMLANMGSSASVLAQAQRTVDGLNDAIHEAPSRRSLLLKLYLWAVEFGFMGDAGSGGRVVGAGILSSKTELQWAISTPKFEISKARLNTPYDFTNLQKQYFSFKGWNALEELLLEI